MTIVPGFIDCHNHAPGDTLLYEVLVGNPYVVEFVTIASIVDKLRAKAQQTPPGTWVEGFFFDDTKVKDNRQLNVHDLDQVSKDHPVAVHHRGGHTAYYNSKALGDGGRQQEHAQSAGRNFRSKMRMAISTAASPIGRWRWSTRSASGPVFTAEQTLQRNRDGLAYISKQFVRYGLTSVHHEGGDLFALQQVRASGDLKHRVSYEASGKVLEAMISSGIDDRLRRRVDPARRDLRAHRRWVVLRTHHGAEQAVSRQNSAVPGQPHRIAGRAERLGGARASRRHSGQLPRQRRRRHRSGADGCTSARRGLFPRADARPKITHCTLINDDLVRRMKALDAVPAPFTSYAYYNTDKFHFYGEEMMKHCMAYRTFLDAGIHVAAGSDFDPGPFDPRMGIQGMVTRTGWNGETWGANQRISVEEALRVNTLNGAYNSHEEAIKGSITPGKLADFVVLADDLYTVDHEKIKDIEIVRTVVGGSTIYQA